MGKRYQPRPETEDDIRLKRGKADKIELEVKAKRGELIEIKTAKALFADIAGTLKERLEVLPIAVAKRCHLANSPAEVEKIIREEINTVLAALYKQGSSLSLEKAERYEQKATETKPASKGKASKKASKEVEEEDFEPYEDDADDDDDFNPYEDDED